MAFENYVANFSAVLPRMRSVASISADVELWRSGRATDITRSQVASVELQIRTADDLYQRRQYDAAMQQFRQARASIYALLYPGFDVSAYGIARDRMLPVSATLETSFIDLGLRLTDSMRPLTIESTPVTRILSAESVPATLVQFQQTGFREAQGGEDLLQAAASHGIALLNDGKPEAAIDVMAQALAAGSASTSTDRALLAAVNLNMASAFVQAGTPDKAIEFAQVSQELFRSTQDQLGFAQALHGEAVATQRKGDRKGLSSYSPRRPKISLRRWAAPMRIRRTRRMPLRSRSCPHPLPFCPPVRLLPPWSLNRPP